MKIKGITVGTTTPRPDWNQDNPNRADYIKNKPTDLLHGTDATLSVSGKAADAKAVGDAIAEAKNKTKTDETLTASGVAADAKATGEKIAEIEETIAGMGLTATDDGTGVVTLQFSSEGGGGSGGGGGSAVSPTVEVEEIEGGHAVTITDVYGPHSFVVMDGDPGHDGYTPVKGKDYYTEADKQEMVSLVLAALPAAEGVSY